MKQKHSLRTVLLVFAVLLVPFFACPGEAQYPKPTRKPVSSYDIARHITSARFSLDAAALAREPLAGGLFAVRPGVAGLPASPFAG